MVSLLGQVTRSHTNKAETAMPKNRISNAKVLTKAFSVVVASLPGYAGSRPGDPFEGQPTAWLL
jgi:hypothetical protein